MREIRTILVPTDFSAGARSALDQAVALAQRLGSTIRLLHCYRVPTEIELTYISEHVEDWEEGIREGVTRQLDELVACVAGHGLTVTRELARGHAATEIARAASANADLIVMGTLGRTGLAHLVLGSVAERTVREASCPVLVVRPRESAPPLPQTLVVPIDFSPASDRALEYTRELLSKLGAGHVVLVHAHDVEDLPSLPQSQRDSLARALSKFAPRELEELGSQLKQAGLGYQVNIDPGSPAHVICERARSERADWIVMSSHGRSGPSRWLIGSVAERVLRTAPCSVLVLRSRG
jgi:nucleotide-binding universal stress UspA family protein